MTEFQIFDLIANELSLKPSQIKTVSNFLDDGATVPFSCQVQERSNRRTR